MSDLPAVSTDPLRDAPSDPGTPTGIKAEAMPRAQPLSGVLQKLQVHPLREDLYNELHSRPFHVVSTPAQMTHIAIQHGGKLLEEEMALLTALCTRFQVTAPTTKMPCFHQDFGLFELRWERHMEFSGYTFIHQGGSGGKPFERNAIDYVPQEWLNLLPGTVVAAFHLQIEDGQKHRGITPLEVSDYFEKLRMVGSQPVNGMAEVWTTFRLHSDGFGRFLIYNMGLSESKMGRLSQRFIELETYRLMSTLGLPLARELAPQLTRLDLKLKAITLAIASPGGADEERSLLTRLSQMASQVEAHRSSTNYRFSATSAYHQVVLQRLEVLREKEREVAGHLTINEFLVRRLSPAVRTCEVMGARLDDLSTRIDRASELLRTRVELGIEEQNQQLLSSMDRRSKIQLRMQQTVEGLSVAAISYYLVGLLKILFETLYELGVPLDKAVATGLSVPMVVLTVWWGTRRIHHHFSALDKDDAG